MFNAIGRPFGILLMFLYELFNSYGAAILLIAVLIRVILLPFQMKGKLGSMRTQRLQPKIQEIQKKYASDKTKAQAETMKLYKEENASPTSGCLWNLLPIPIMFALFFVISQPLTMMMGVPAEYLEPDGVVYQELYELGFDSEIAARHEQIAQAQFINDHFYAFEPLHVPHLRAVNFRSLGMDLGSVPQWNLLWNTDDWSLSAFLLFLIPILSGGFQFVHTKINQKIAPAGSPEGAGGQMRTVMLLMPLFSVYIAFITPAALGIYWTAGTVLMIGQDVWLTKRYTKIIDAEDEMRNAEREKKEKELEAKRKETERRKAEGEDTRNPNTSKRKQHMTEKQADAEKAAEWKKKHDPQEHEETPEDPSKSGNRRYARGRAYDPDRYPELPEQDEEYPDEIDVDEADETAEVEEAAFEAEATEEAEELADDAYPEDEDKDSE